MDLIKILNGQRQLLSFTGGLSVWCDRRSVLGNPFGMCMESDRDAVCDGYSEYFDLVLMAWDPLTAAEKIAGEHGLTLAYNWNPPTFVRFKDELARLEESLVKDGALGLGCWCAPKRCHCDTIAAYLMGKLGVADENVVTQGSLF
jgi:hypothetical protein